MKIILAIDGKKYSEAAADMLARLHLNAEDHLRIVNVVDMAVPLATDLYGGYLPEAPDFEKAAKDNAQQIVTAAKERVASFFGENCPEMATDVLFGSPDSRIVETAEEEKADLIIMGSHGYKRWERLLLGSVSDSVVRHAPCSVLIVRSSAS